MIVDVEIPLSYYVEIEEAMVGKGGEHVVEESDAGINAGAAGAVEIDR